MIITSRTFLDTICTSFQQVPLVWSWTSFLRPDLNSGRFAPDSSFVHQPRRVRAFGEVANVTITWDDLWIFSKLFLLLVAEMQGRRKESTKVATCCPSHTCPPSINAEPTCTQTYKLLRAWHCDNWYPQQFMLLFELSCKIFTSGRIYIICKIYKICRMQIGYSSQSLGPAPECLWQFFS